MKRISNIIIFLLAAICMAAAAPLTPVQKQEAIRSINKAAAGIRSMSCSFVQTKHMSMLNDKMVSKGTMNYKQSNKLRWEYASPYKYLFIFNGTKVYVGNDSRKDVIDTNSNKVFREIARIMMNTVTGKALSDPADFATDVTANTGSWIVTLVPKKKDMRKMFKKIELMFNKSDSMVSQVNLFEPNGDRTEIRMSNVKINTAINENRFAVPAK